MSSNILNTKDNFKVKFGFIRSVSLIFYSKTKGFLLCNELRKHFSSKIMNSHIIGGKVDLEDENPLITAFREFIEETGYNSTVNQMLKNFQNFIKFDFCVSISKNLYNRFYIINIDNLKDNNITLEFYNFTSNWTKNINLPLDSIYWWNSKNYNELILPSNLLKSFIEFLPSEELLKTI